MSKTELETTTPEQQTEIRTWRRPRYEVSETEDAFDIKVRVPGVKRDGVDISVDGENLSIIGKRTLATPKGWRPLRREFPEGDFRLNLRLNVLIQEDKIHAGVENGVLDLILPKADAVKPRKIKIH